MAKKGPCMLLPVGFYDLLFDEAEQNHRKINLAIDSCLNAGYRLIKTPLVEFCDNFDNGALENSFVIRDVISGKNMALRNDITLQLSRLLQGRLKNEKLPLKICYVGDVLLTKSNELYADRQSTQLGLEIIGCDQYKSNLEIIDVILQILPKISSKKLTIEISLPNFLQDLCFELGFAKNEELQKAIKKKNISKIYEIAGKNAGLIAEIALKNTNFYELSQKILKKCNSDKIVDELKKAANVSQFVSQKFPKIGLCFDLFGDNYVNSYHKEIAFDVFCEGAPYAIARGGRYEIDGIDAVGATIYMNYLRKI